MEFPYTPEILVYRKPRRDNWGNELINEDSSKYPLVYGRVYSHTILNGTIGPRVDERYEKAPFPRKITYTGSTLYCDPDEDVTSGDLLVVKDESGRRKIFQVEGEGEADFISPFSGYLGGKEVYIGRYQPGG